MPSDESHSSRPFAEAIRKHVRGRWLVRLVSSLLIGIVLTFAVAWTGAGLIGLRNARTARSVIGPRGGENICYGYINQAVLGTRLLLTWRNADSFFAPIEKMQNENPEAKLLIDPAPHWSRVQHWPSSNAGVIDRLKTRSPNEARFEEAWGFPFRALSVVYGFDDLNGRIAPVVEGSGIDLPPFSTLATGENHRALPLTPCWTGLLLDIAFWMPVAYVMLFAWPVARDTRRLRHGRCLECGYDLRGQLKPHDTTEDGRCPECGTSF